MPFRTDVRLFVESVTDELSGPHFPRRVARVVLRGVCWVVVGTLLTLLVLVAMTARWVWTWIRFRKRPLD